MNKHSQGPKKDWPKLRLILNADELLALTRRLIDWGKWQCPPSEIDEHCTGCWWQERDCPLMEAEALLEKITGEAHAQV